MSGLSALPFEARKHFAQVFNNLMRRDLAGFVGYVERNPEILSKLVAGYENPDIALNCGTMLREVGSRSSVVDLVSFLYILTTCPTL